MAEVSDVSRNLIEMVQLRCPLSALRICQVVILVVNLAQVAHQLSYSWPVEDRRFDCVIFVTLSGYHRALGYVSEPTGVRGSKHIFTIVTSMNAIEPYFYKHNLNRIGIYKIEGAYNKFKVNSARQCFQEAYTSTRWSNLVRVGFDKKFTTTSDMIHMTIYSDMKPYRSRKDFYAFPVCRSDDREPSRYVYVDIVPNYSGGNISSNFELEVYYIENDEVVDCDEFLPRAWGRFICVENAHRALGISNGAVLFKENLNATCPVGLGAFELTKGKESILVFSDIIAHYFGWYMVWRCWPGAKLE